MKKILIVIGSVRKNGFNYQLSNMLSEKLNSEYEIKYLEYSNIPYMNQDLENPELDVIKNIRKQVKESDLILMFTPEYNYAYSGVLKNLLDWLSRPLIFNDYTSTAVYNKKVVVSGIGGKNEVKDARAMLMNLLKVMNMNVLDYSIGFKVNDDAWVSNKVILDEKQEEDLNDFADKIREFI